MLEIGFRFGSSSAKRILKSFRHMHQTFFIVNSVSVLERHITHKLVTLIVTISNLLHISLAAWFTLQLAL